MGDLLLQFVDVATHVGVQTIITVNYGTGTPAEAAAWVAYCKTNGYAFKYWEIGNECYGTWETDSNTLPHNPYTYAVRAQQYIQQMKAADPTIKIGVVAAPGEDSYDNDPSLSATNTLTGQAHSGWTPVLLATLKSLGVTPDFIINHRYQEYSAANSSQSSDCDALLLQSAPAWAGDASDLRAQVGAYFGAGGTGIELLATENNSDSGAQGRQSTSLVNGLYFADSLAQLMRTEFNSFIWWDLRNGSDTTGSFDPTLYGWRNNGDLGVVDSTTNRYPAFYAAKLMQHFVENGGSILSATSDFSLLSAYASRHANGSVSLLVINKNPVASLNTQVTLTGYVPGANASMYSFGIPQDNAAQSGIGSPDLLQTNSPVAGTTFNYNFPAYSLNLFTFSPAAPQLAVLPPPGSGQFQLQGQPSVRYVIQNSTNLSAWSSVATNTLSSTTLNLTYTLNPAQPAQFWRAVWIP